MIPLQTFAPARIRSGSLSELCICLYDATKKSHAWATHTGASSLQCSNRDDGIM